WFQQIGVEAIMTIEVSANIASQPRSGGTRAAGTRAKSQAPARAASDPYQIAKIVRRGSRLVTGASATLRDPPQNRTSTIGMLSLLGRKSAPRSMMPRGLCL